MCTTSPVRNANHTFEENSFVYLVWRLSADLPKEYFNELEACVGECPLQSQAWENAGSHTEQCRAGKGALLKVMSGVLSGAATTGIQAPLNGLILVWRPRQCSPGLRLEPAGDVVKYPDFAQF